MQALLFGTRGLNLFGDAATRNAMLVHLDAVCRIGAGLGATRLVFGSPKNRDRTGLSDAQAETLAIDFFRRLGDIAGNHRVQVCLEPNPPCYGANFMITSAEPDYRSGQLKIQ
jgi:sugar phosphate isomerase/epimerase